MLARLISAGALLVAVTSCDGCSDPQPPGALGGPGGQNPPPLFNVDPADVDGDGIANVADLDVDGDRVENGADDDIDGDGRANADDSTPYGENPDGLDGPYADNDGDGLVNLVDSDDDNDGIPDGVNGNNDCNGDGVGEDEAADCDGYCIDVEAGWRPCDDGVPAGSGSPDDDGDGLQNTVDPDDDADGVIDGDDHQPHGQDPCVNLEGAPPASCFDEPEPTGEGETEQPPPSQEQPPPSQEQPRPTENPPPPPPPPPACSTETFNPAQPIPPRILLVVDRSNSMNEEAPGFPASKWEATREALVGPLFGGDGGVVGQLEDRVEMGLFLYPGASEDDVCALGALSRTVDLENHSSIKTALYLTDPTGATPTAGSLLEAKEVLDFLGDDGGQRAIILATDGGPNCNRSLDGDTCRCVGTRAQCAQFSANCLDDNNAVGAAGALSAAGYPVYILGINGSETFQDVLDRMAQAGGTGASFSVSSSSSLASTIEGIATEVGSCRFDVAGFPDEADLTVRVDGSVVTHDDGRTNGWDIVGLSTLEFFGSACDAVLAASQSITVERCE